jgi:ubiquinone/menaquinone biosynthesis C-methylase UbiE
VQEVSFKRAAEIVAPILPWVMNSDGTILDFGCGLGHIGYLISQKTGREAEYYDVRSYPYAPSGVEIKVFDGKTLPCRDGEFDTSLVVFVLHHSPDPDASLHEVVRVSRRYVLICEDLVKSRREMIIEAIKDTIANFFLPHMTFQYRIEEDWEEMFGRFGLTIEQKTYFQTKYIFTFKHVAWLLAIT